MEERDRRILAFAMLLAETGNAKDIMKRMKFDNYSISMVDRLTKKCTCDFDISKIELRKFISKSGLDMMELLYMLRQAYYSGFGDEYSEYMMEIDRMSKACYEQIVADKDGRKRVVVIFRNIVCDPFPQPFFSRALFQTHFVGRSESDLRAGEKGRKRDQKNDRRVWPVTTVHF